MTRNQLPAIAEMIRAISARKGVAMIAIDGPGGSGKSRTAHALVELLPQESSIVHVDDFYLPSTQRKNDVKAAAGNFDLARLQEQVLIPLSQKRQTSYQRYDWPSDRILPESTILEPRGAIIVEGVYSLTKRLRSFYNVSIWIQCDAQLCLARGIERDGESMREQWLNVWMPAERYYVQTERPQDHADFIVDGTMEI